VCVSGKGSAYCVKMADWIWVLFGVVSGVSRGMDVLDGAVIVKIGGAVLEVNLGHSCVRVMCCS